MPSAAYQALRTRVSCKNHGPMAGLQVIHRLHQGFGQTSIQMLKVLDNEQVGVPCFCQRTQIDRKVSAAFFLEQSGLAFLM